MAEVVTYLFHLPHCHIVTYSFRTHPLIYRGLFFWVFLNHGRGVSIFFVKMEGLVHKREQ